MIGQCAAPRPDSGLVRGLIDTVDCNLREGVGGAYQALFGPGSALGAAITAMLTLYVALYGWRLLSGRGDLRVGDLPGMAVKIGAVVLLASSWTAYQGLVFATLFDAPAEMAAGLLTALPTPPNEAAAGVPADIFARLQYAFDRMTQAAAALAVANDNPGGGPAAAGVTLQAGGLVLQAAPGTDPEALKGISPVIQMRSALQGGPAFGATALWLSSVTLLTTTLGLVVLAKLMLGLLLALGPVFVGMLLFDATKGLFEGWLRAALGFALVPLATMVFAAALLASLEPSLQAIEAARGEGRYDNAPVLTVLIVTLVFTAVFASVIGMCTRVAAGFRLPESQPAAADSARSAAAQDAAARPSATLDDTARATRLAAALDPARASDPGEAARASRLAAAVSGGAPGPSAAPGAGAGPRALTGRSSAEAARIEIALTDRLGQTARRRSGVLPRTGLKAARPRAGASAT